MQLLLQASPSFLSIAVGGLALYLSLSSSLQKSCRSLSFRFVCTSLFLAILLALSGLLGLIKLSHPENPRLVIAEPILQELVRLGLSLLLASIMYPSTVSSFLTRPAMGYTPQATTAWIIAILAFSTFVLNTTSYCLKSNFFVPSFITSTLATILTGNLLIWIIIACRKWKTSQDHYRAWLVALFSQVLNIVIAAAQMPHTNIALYLTRGFSLLLWVLATIFFVSQIARIEDTAILSPIKPPETFQVHPKRHVSASEDFRCRDPFAGPLGVSSHTISAIPLTRAAPYKSLLSATGKRQNRARFVPPRQVPKSSHGRPSLHFFSMGSSKPTVSFGTESGYVGAFYTAEAFSEEREGKRNDNGDDFAKDLFQGKPQPGSSAIGNDQSGHPNQVHLPLRIASNEHFRTQPRPSRLFENPSSPKNLATEIQAKPAISAPSVNSHGHKNLSIDRTPTQSMYLAKQTAIAQSNVETTEKSRERMDRAQDSSRKSFLEIEDMPSFDSMRSIPSLVHTPDQTFCSDYDTTVHFDKDDSLTTEVSPGNVSIIEPFLGTKAHEKDITHIETGTQDTMGFEFKARQSISSNRRGSKVVENDIDPPVIIHDISS
ncbi:hypothetical protein CPB86DRAFT_870530 [Serendipita vermifera]|nr:hypothetical protein CPB86DRAFT_870530 [Serendipita vermifera]